MTWLLFRFLGFGFRLAMSNVGWLVPQKFVILVPDPIAFAPRPALLDPGEPCDICQYTSFRPPIAGLSAAPWNKDDMGDGVPTDQLSHNHCDCTDSHCNSHIFTSCVFVLVLHSHRKSIGGRSSSATSSRRRARRARPREARFVTLANLTRQSLRVMEPVSHQASLRGRLRSWRRASRQG